MDGTAKQRSSGAQGTLEAAARRDVAREREIQHPILEAFSIIDIEYQSR